MLNKIFPVLREIRSKEGVLHFRCRQLFRIGEYFLCVHSFWQAEKDPYEHDHPRDFIAMGIYGGYVEQHNWKEVEVPPFKPRLLRAEYHHKILRLRNGKKAMTLSFCGPQRRIWGYVKQDGTWVSNEDYFKQKKEGQHVIHGREND